MMIVQIQWSKQKGESNIYAESEKAQNCILNLTKQKDFLKRIEEEENLKRLPLKRRGGISLVSNSDHGLTLVSLRDVHSSLL